MTTRAYDYILKVENANYFISGNVIQGLTTNTVAEIVAIESNNIKVRMSNVYNEFLEGETVSSQSAVMLTTNTFIELSDNIDGQTNTFSLPTTFVLSDSIQVYVDGVIVPKNKYVYNANDSITFKNSNTLIDSESLLYEEKIFPGIDNDRLHIQVVVGNIESSSFVGSNLINYVETASSTIEAVYNAPYISEKNSTQQTPLIKLYTVYYPGEWYPTNDNGNPTKSGEGYAWPYGFPLRYAEVVGETFNDFNYYISFGGHEYKVIALSSSDISFDTSSGISSITLEIGNFDGAIASIIENPNIVGHNTNNSTIAFNNGDEVKNIDPRTVFGNIHYDTSVVLSRGSNAVWDYNSTIANGDSWIPLKEDSRDLLGGVVEIKLSYAKFLDYWPEYSTVRSSTPNSVSLYSSAPYRIGDIVTSNSTLETTTIIGIKASNVYFSDNALNSLSMGDKLLIVNQDADKNSYIKSRFLINKLNELSETLVSFELVDWMQHFKEELPKRRFYTNTCPWKYKGEECKYPINGTSFIVGSNPPVAANGLFTYDNAPTANVSEDVCSKTLTACKLRGNLLNFGGFPGVKEQ